MPNDGILSRVKVQQIIENQVPEFILDESPKFVEFLKQYCISQEYQSGPVDLTENLDQYLKLDNLVPEIIVGNTNLEDDISNFSEIIRVSSTKGFPSKYGLIKIDDEIITYTGITTDTFTGCIRGFSGITKYHRDLDYEDLVFSSSESDSHLKGSKVENLSTLFLKEFFNKFKYTFTPELEKLSFVDDLNVGNFIKQIKSLYKSKGTEESFRILFGSLFGVDPKVINLEEFLFKSSAANYIRREIIVAKEIYGDPSKLIGQTIFKSTDINSTASVSEVEIINRSNQIYYKILLFVGYDDVQSAITGSFNITGNTRIVEKVSVGSSVISVDSTIGFPDTGSLYTDNGDEIFYTEKSVNQFLGCSNIVNELKTSEVIRSNETYYGYENGDLNKKVEIRITGVISKFVPTLNPYGFSVGEKIRVNFLGEKIKFPAKDIDITNKEIFSNSLIYNTSFRYRIKNILGNGNQIEVFSEIDGTSLKVSDKVEIVFRDSQIVAFEEATIISISGKIITLDINLLNINGKIDLRRKLNKAKSTLVPIEFGNNSIISDVQNLYNENNEFLYIASNCLPSYEIGKNILKYSASSIDGIDVDTLKYSILKFSDEVEFITGDEVFYQEPVNSSSDLKSGTYYVQVSSNKKDIILYASRSFVNTNNYVEFTTLPDGFFILYSQKSGVISPQKILKKFPINPNMKNGKSQKTSVGSIGITINGVEIINYKSDDKIYYGPLERINVFNGGEDYDVINPPKIEISPSTENNPNGERSVLYPVVRGSIKKIHIKPQEFDIGSKVYVEVTGGNGGGSNLVPVLKKRRREIEFDARIISEGGGLDIQNDSISFIQNHNLIDRQVVIYDPNSNKEIGVGPYEGSNLSSGFNLINNASYYVKVLNSRSIQLYPSLSDYSSGINTVGFTTVNASGIHKFKTDPKNTLSEILVLNGGEGYENREIKVNSSGISTFNNSINFTNHGFGEGELIEYKYDNNPIVGLSTVIQYRVINISNNEFRLSNAGIGGTDTSNYSRKNFIRFGNIGEGNHIFKYPDIIARVNYTVSGVGTDEVESITATPIVRGSIVEVLLYEKGTDYGSNILNFHKKPSITIKNGSESKIDVLVRNGTIVNVNVLYGGNNYFSTPDLIVSGEGIGADLYPIISNNKIVDVVIANGGVGYSQNTTSVIVKNPGKNAVLDPSVRELTLNNSYRFGSESLSESINNLQYGVYGYDDKLREEFNDNIPSEHSPIIGWAYDGIPIYGNYGYRNPSDINSSIKSLKSGFKIDENSIVNRPNSDLFPYGFFIEDYVFDNSGDLDKNNGRYSITPEFPNGVYAYYASVDENTSGELIPRFPYFIGESYRSNLVEENKDLSQDFDFINSNLIRNTFPYKLGEEYADNDFIIESNEFIEQNCIVESVRSETISSLEIINSGNNYKVNDVLFFDDEGTGGAGLVAKVSEIEGKSIVDINTSIEEYNDAIITWNNENELKVNVFPSHEFNNLDNLILSGISATIPTNKDNTYNITVETFRSTIFQDIPPFFSTVGIVTDIYVSSIPTNVSVGSSALIENEIIKILNVYRNLNILRVFREPNNIGIGYSSSTPIKFNPDSFTIKTPVKVEYFDSSINKKEYFNPAQSIGIGTTPGLTIETSIQYGDTIANIYTPTQSIFIPNHQFETSQQITLHIPDIISTRILVYDSTSGNITYQIPFTGTSQKLYVIKKSKDHIGLVTNVGLTTISDGLFFAGFTPNEHPKDYQYLIEENNIQVKSKVERIVSTVSVSTDHQLSYLDKINLSVKPALTKGTRNNDIVKIKLNDGKILANPIGFNSSSVDISNNQINIPFHNLKTGDKIFYKSYDELPSGISTDYYYINKIDDDKISFCNNYLDCFTNPPIIVSIGSTGGKFQEISSVNPPLSVVKNNNLLVDLSDSSLVGHNFKIFYDNNFNNEFISTGSVDKFSTSGIGTVGVSSEVSFNLNYSEDLPDSLYYTLEKFGELILSDREVVDFSSINFVDSDYNGNYNVYGMGNTTFQISLTRKPEKFSYNSLDGNLSYKTNSSSSKGPISKVRIITGGENYKEMPTFSGSSSLEGKGAYILPKSKVIGSIIESRLVDVGFDYPSDVTLKPSGFVPSLITLESSQFISNIKVLYGGKNYISKPNIIIINEKTGKKIDSGVLECDLVGTSIQKVNIIESPSGLSESDISVRTINNENGIFITSVQSISGIVTCTLSTPLVGFSEDPFKPGDLIYVEGIQKIGSEGSGFNSEDYGYKFFKVTNYIPNSNPGILEFDISNLTTNPGTPKLIQESLSRVVNEKNYPKFEITQNFSTFIEGEKLLVDSGLGYVSEDLYVSSSSKNFAKVFGNYKPTIGEKVFGSESGSIGTIQNIILKDGKFEVRYSSKINVGWENDIGTLNSDIQRVPDNDYYQNLSYTIKSPIEYEKFITPVNNIVHVSGLKNFGDLEVESSSDFKPEYFGKSNEMIISDFIQENRVDTINNLDLAIDINTIDNKISNSIKFQNLKLTNYIQCKTNRVLKIDDISPLFLNKNLEPSQSLNLLPIEKSDRYNRFLVQVRRIDGSELEFFDIVVLNDSKNLFTLEKSSIKNVEKEIGDVTGYEDIEGNFYLRFDPVDPFGSDYEIKIVKNIISNIRESEGIQSIGLVDLINSNKKIPVGESIPVLFFNADKYSSIHSSIQIIDDLNSQMNYVEIYLSHDGSNSYISEYYFSTDDFNSNSIGFFNTEIINGTVFLSYTNDTQNIITIVSKNVGFGSTSLGGSTYRYLEFGQIPGNERTSKYDSSFSISSGNSNIISLDSSLFSSVKSTIRVGYGKTSSLHQVSLIQDGTSIYTLQYPFLSIGSTSGIGTFGGEYNGNNIVLKFYPDPSVSSEYEILSYTESLYTNLDLLNSSQILKYGNVSESIFVSEFFAIDGDRINRDNFEANYLGFPIFKKIFNPINSNILNLETGLFTIQNHFFSNLEEIIYRPKSTFIGVGEEPLGIGLTENYLGIVTDRLPSKLYVIKENNNQFKLSTKKEYAQSGIYVTFTSFGEGNAHELEMSNKLEKSIISLDNIVQYPITFSKLSFKLLNNGGEIDDQSNFIQLSGISSIRTGDFLKIEDEYAKVVNVGLGTTNKGPISSTGSNTLVEVLRGTVGTSATSHIDLTDVYVHRGSINIVGNRIYFADPPLGGADEEKYLEFNLEAPRSSFNGRIFLRQDYTSNEIYDDISSEFTGIGATYNLTVQGNNVANFVPTDGNGIVFLNNIFQTPTTENNLGNNYSIEGESITGITSVIFTGIKTEGGNIVISDYDVNQNQLPRGGLVVSLGSTPGLGFAPLVGATIIPTLDQSGSIIGISTLSNFGSGYFGNVSIGITDSTGSGSLINATVGAGGSLILDIQSGGQSYTNPYIELPDPSYTNLPVIGVSRIGLGNTTETGKGMLLNIEVGASSTTGIGSTLYEVKSFKITRPGYGFRKGDVVKPVGLVTGHGLPSIINDFELTIVDTFTDSFSAWQLGELDYIDSIKNLQDGTRIRFPLFYKGSLLSFEIDRDDADSSLIDFDSLLIIFINGILQNPKESYNFSGGSTFIFNSPPKQVDQVDIFFYNGTKGLDTLQVSVKETIKEGDIVQLFKNNNLLNSTITQEIRAVYEISASDLIRTNLYTGNGIDETNFKPLSWTKQKVDKILDGRIVSKSRDSIESTIYPTSKVIKNFSEGDTEIFLDNIDLFNYENEPIINFDSIIISPENNIISANIAPIVSSGGTIQELVIINGGSGYIGTSFEIEISNPFFYEVGINSTFAASATANIVDGSVDTISIINPGLGYTESSPPQIFIPHQPVQVDSLRTINSIKGFSGKIVGIKTTNGLFGNPLALEFTLEFDPFVEFNDLLVGYPIHIFNTKNGDGTISIDLNDLNVVGIGTTFLDNIYYVHSRTQIGISTGTIKCNVLSGTNIIGIETSGSFLGNFSWGRLSNFERSSSPKEFITSGKTIDADLSAFPTFQRRNYGLRLTGALKKQL